MADGGVMFAGDARERALCRELAELRAGVEEVQRVTRQTLAAQRSAQTMGVVCLICHGEKLAPAQVMRAPDRTHGRARARAMYLLHYGVGLSHSDCAAAFDMSQPAATRAIRRVAGDLRHDRALKRDMDRLMGLICEAGA